MDRKQEQLLDAAASNNLPKVAELLGAGVSPNGYTPGLDSPLIAAAKIGRTEIVDLLIRAGADLDFRGYGDNTALMSALVADKLPVAQQLVDAGAGSDVLGYNNQTALMLACSKNTHSSVAHALLKKGANTDIQNTYHDTALHSAARSNNHYAAHLLLEHGANPNVVGRYDRTPLILAVENENIDIIKKLIISGADVNQQGQGLQTPLFYAVVKGSVPIANMLIAAGADVTIASKNHKTPPMIAKGMAMKKLLRNAEKDKRPSLESVGLPAELTEAPKKELPSIESVVFPEVEAENSKVGNIIIGEHTRRIIEGNSSPRAENDALESLVKDVIGDKFIAELAYRKGFGPEQLHELEGAGIQVEREYETGPDPKWRVDLWVGNQSESLERTVSAMAEQLKESLGKAVIGGEGQKGITMGFHDSLDDIVSAFNTLLSEPISKIDMTELRTAAKAEARNKKSQTQDLAR